MTRADLWRLERNDRGILAPGPWFWPRAAVWLFALFACAVFAFFASFQLCAWLRLPKETRYYVAILVPALTLVLYAAAVKIFEKRNAHEISLSSVLPSILSGSAVGFAFMSLSLALLWLLRFNSLSLGQWKDWYFYLVFNSYISAVIEELGFRAILLRLLARMFGPVPGLVASAALFALAHASHAPPIALALLLVNGGLLLGVLYMVSGSLWTSIGAHIAYDFTEWSLFGVGDKDGLLVVTPSPQYPAWLTGGSFGPDGSILSALISTLLIAAIILARRRCAEVRGLQEMRSPRCSGWLSWFMGGRS